MMKILLDKIMYEKNLTIRQASVLTGAPKSTIADIVSGTISPRVDTMEQLAKGLNVRITDLLETDIK